MREYLVILVLVIGLFVAGFAAGYAFRGIDEPVGGIPTAAAAMQMAAPLSENEAGQTATPPATDPATSTAAPTVAQPTSAPTATATPTKEEWEIECPSTGGTIKCHDVIVSEDGETARLYWVGPCLDPYSLRLAKKAHGQVFPELLSGEWAFKFIPNKCDRPSDRASRNYLLIRTFAGPGEYAMTFEPVGSNSVYIEFFEWSNAPAATATLETATPQGSAVEWVTATPEVDLAGTMDELVQSSSPLRGFAASPTEDLHSTPGDGAEWVGTIWYASPVYIWECGVALSYPDGTYLSLVTHEDGENVQVGWIATASYTDRHPCSYYSAPGVGALINYLVAAGYGDESEIRDLPGLQYDPYQGVNQDLDD